jgi:hypothetical protein
MFNPKQQTIMKAKLTMAQIWANESLSDFFFRKQAYNTLEEMVARSADGDLQTMEKLDKATDNMDIDDVEEIFYSESVEYCAEEFGIELEEEEDEQ